MKKILKALAIMLALVLTVSLAQPLSAEAASKPKLNCKKKTIYVGGSSVYPAYANDSITLKLKNKPSKYSVTWTSSNSDIASVEALGKYKSTVTAVAPGAATITAEVIDMSKTPNTKYTLTCKVTIKANCAAVDITPATVEPLEIGKTAALTATMYNAAGKALKSGSEVTDIINWVSSDEDVATVSSTGVVTAVSSGTATITCYTVQAASGTYSKLAKATAKDTITITVKEEDKVIKSVSQKSLKTFNVEFGRDYSQALKLDNFKLTFGSTDIALAKVEFAKDGKSALVTAKSELTANTVYTLNVSGTASNSGVTASFTTSSGVPAAMKIYTGISGNLAVVAQQTDIKFAMYDAEGVDITPTDEKSNAYQNYENNINYKISDNNLIYGLIYGKTLIVYEENKQVTVTATYYDYKTRLTLNAAMTVSSVSEAATMTFAGYTVTKSSKPASELDWEHTNNKLSSSDFGAGYKIVARVRKADGTYIYSDAASTKITFSIPENYTPSSVFSDANGTLRPFQSGADYVLVKYDGVVLASATVIVGEARVPAAMKVLVDGVEAQTVTISDQYGVTNPEVKIAIYDNYGELWNLSSWSDLKFECSAPTSPNVYASGLTSDGMVNVFMFAYGSGSLSGKSYTYLVEYNNGNSNLYCNFTILSYTPNTNLTTTYRPVVTGDKDMVVNSSFDTANGKSVKITLVGYKGNVRYEDVQLRANKASAAVGEYYIVVYNSTRTEITGVTIDNGTAILPIAWTEGSGIKKLVPGTYTFEIYQRTSGENDTRKAGGNFTLTDSQEGATFEQTSAKTLLTITPDTVTKYPSVANAILAQCFNFWFEGQSATAEITKAISGDKYLIIQTVNVTGTIKIGETSYSITVPLTVNKGVNQSY